MTSWYHLTRMDMFVVVVVVVVVFVVVVSECTVGWCVIFVIPDKRMIFWMAKMMIKEGRKFKAVR